MSKAQGVRSRFPAHGDERDLRADESKELPEALVRRTVMRDLQELDLRRTQREGHRRFRVSGEKRIELPIAREQNDPVLVRISAGWPGPSGQRTRICITELEELADARGHDSHAMAASLAFERGHPGCPSAPAGRGRSRLAANRRCRRHRPRGLGAGGSRRARRGEGPSAWSWVATPPRAGPRRRVRRPPRLQQDPVSLADVEHHDPETLRRRRRVVRT